MFLLLTTSVDVTADLIVRFATTEVFRLNVDMLGHYEIEFSPGHWKIKDPIGREITSRTASRCLRWKTSGAIHAKETLVEGEVKYFVDELYGWFRSRGLIVGNAPWTDRELGKIRQAEIAARHFRIPTQSFVIGGPPSDDELTSTRVVAKSLSSSQTADGRGIFTTEVELESLDFGYPWMLQELIAAQSDLTVVLYGRELALFSRSREGLAGLDWRYETFHSHTEWEREDIPPEVRGRILKMLDSFNMSWGRIDFLRVNNDWVFLEINPNGQWVFLDPANSLGLISDVVRYLCEGATHG